MIKYKVEILDLNLHLFQVSLAIPKPQDKQVLMMPSWIPGSYVIRDFAKQLGNLTASQSGCLIDFTQIKSNEWVLNLDKSDSITITYQVYAFDKSVRGAFLDNQRGFINGTSLFMLAVGFEKEAYEIELVDPALNWQVVTGLSCSKGTNRYAFGKYQAKHYAQLLDCPILMGKLLIKSFRVENIPHDIAISGNQEGDFDKLTQDVQKICETQVSFFKTLPNDVSYYCFLLHVGHEGYGGIEHVNSSSLLINKFAIPDRASSLDNQFNLKKPYLDLLGLFSHEYFHLWMAKQIKPVVFLNYDLTQPNYTTQLWAFEGFTAYYDDLMLVRAGLISQEQYFSLLSENINKLLKVPGRKYQTLKSASFDAWIKFYKPDENSINSTVSYYLKGALLALCLDLQLRTESKNELNLDHIMHKLWSNFGQLSKGVEEGDIEKLIGEFNIPSVQELLNIGLNTTEELPIESILRKFGLDLNNTLNESNRQLDFGAKIADLYTMLLCLEVYHEGLFQTLGVQPGDLIIACQHHRITHQNHQLVFQKYLNQIVDVSIFREDKLLTLTGKISEEFFKQLKINPRSGFEDNINKWLLEK